MDKLDKAGKAELIAIHKSDIEVCEYDYIQSLPDPDMIYKRSNVFLGLLENIYQNVISKYIIDTSLYNNDYELLDLLFYSVFLPLTFKYGYTPTLYMYSSFIHSDNAMFTELIRGVYKDGSKVKYETSQTVTKWYNTCKAATLTRAIDDNSIGAIFAAKAAYQMSDQPAPVQSLSIATEDKSAFEIAQKYGSAAPPELPDID